MTAAAENQVPNVDKTETTDAEKKTEVESDVNTAVKSEDTKEEEVITKVVPVAVDNDLQKKIVRQLEYYFGNKNLPNDRFMLRAVSLDNGWIPLTTMLNFKRLASICGDVAKIAGAVAQSDSTLLTLSENCDKLRRNPDVPLPAHSEEVKTAANAKTVYVKGFPADFNIDMAEDFFAPYGKTTYIKLRKDIEHKFKGTVFVEFENIEDAAGLLGAVDVRYRPEDAECLLIKTRNAYFQDKNKNDWYTQDLHEICREKERAHRQFKKTNDPEDYAKFKELRKAFKHLQGVNMQLLSMGKHKEQRVRSEYVPGPDFVWERHYTYTSTTESFVDVKTRDDKNARRDEQLGVEEEEPLGVPDVVEFEKGRVLKIVGLEGVETSREAMKDLFDGYGVTWVTYNKGDSQAHIRFDQSAEDALAAVKKDDKFVLSETELNPVVITGAEEEKYWTDSAAEKAAFYRSNKKRKAENNRGRRGRGGFRNKRRRN